MDDVLDGLCRSERVMMSLGDRFAAPAGRALGRGLGRLWYLGECSSRFAWTVPLGDFARAVEGSIQAGYANSSVAQASDLREAGCES